MADLNDLVEQLKSIGVKGKILRMAQQGQLDKMRCEMPTCYCPKGRNHFDVRSAPMTDWALNADHYPTLRTDGGKLAAGNIRLAHVMCNRTDYAWRRRIRRQLDAGASLTEIAEELNTQKIRAPHGNGRWTASLVRKAYVS